MTTPYRKACYAAAQAARLFLTRAYVAPGFSCPADLPGLGLYDCPETGLSIVLTRNGAIDQKATKERREALAHAKAIAADMAGRALIARDAARARAEAVDSQWPVAELPADFLADLDSAEEAPAAVTAYNGPGPLARMALIAAGLLIDHGMTAPAFAYPLAPVRPALESPLLPMRQGQAAAVLAYGRGAI